MLLILTRSKSRSSEKQHRTTLCDTAAKLRRLKMPKSYIFRFSERILFSKYQSYDYFKKLLKLPCAESYKVQILDFAMEEDHPTSTWGPCNIVTDISLRVKNYQSISTRKTTNENMVWSVPRLKENVLTHPIYKTGKIPTLVFVNNDSSDQSASPKHFVEIKMHFKLNPNRDEGPISFVNIRIKIKITPIN
jgi:hypothetical protein